MAEGWEVGRRAVLGGLAAAPLAARAAAAERPDAPLPIDLAAIPLSCAGSYLAFNLAAGDALPLRLATVRKTAISYREQSGAWAHDLLGIGLDRGAARVTATAAGAALDLPGGAATVAFADPETIRVRVTAGAARLAIPRGFSWRTPADARGFRGFDAQSGHIVEVSRALAHSHEGARELFTLPAGATATLAWRAQTEDGPAREAIDAGPLDAWMRRCPRFAADDTPAKRHATRIAWFLCWNLQVAPSGGYRRTTILSSKRALSQIWSWDNLFNALAVADAAPTLAWAQLRVILDHQRADGMLPDTVSDLRAIYGFTKPPLWGWAVRELVARTPRASVRGLLAQIYPGVARLHDWWFAARDLRGDGVPCYLSGNDSGWDNSTVFDGGWPVQSPDLLALLALDAECLGDLAALLGRGGEAARWRARSAAHLALFHRHFVDGDRLRYVAGTPDGWEPRHGLSLLTRLPILLGERLDAGVRRRIIAELRDPALFAAPCGPASEAVSSKHYDPKGYWRGPVWGPSTLLICAGLRRAGEPALARELGERYRATCALKADFRENYDAVSGAGNDDTGMTWSASDYLLLGRMHDA